MRLLPGQSLDQGVRANGPLSPRGAAELGARLVEALAAAHAKGVLHRDVKPQNVMLGSDGRWMLTDLGIASVAGATRTLTGTGIVTGTLGYIAPERLSGGEPGPAADLWAVGATLYFAVEGQHAYDYDDLPAMIAAVLTRDPNPPKHAGPLAPVIAGLMERDPAKRLDAATAKQQLLAIAGGYPTFENPTAQLPDTDKPTERYGGGTKQLPDGGGGTNLLPDGGGTNLLPDGGGTNLLPDGGGTNLLPDGGGTNLLPDGGSAKLLSDGGTPAVAGVWGHRVLRALAGVMVVMHLAIGALLALIGYALSDGMPIWIAGALAVAITVGAALGAWLAPGLARWLGLPVALAGSAVLMGESIIGASVVVDPERPIAATVLSGIALVSFAIWHRLARVLRGRIVPEDQLGRVTTTFRVTGFAGLLLGAATAITYFVLVETRQVNPAGGDYITPLLMGSGVVVLVAALLAIPVVRSASTAPGKRWAAVVTFVVALVLPVFVGFQATARYVDRQDDFTAVPDVCGADILSEDRIAEFIESPPEPVRNSYTNEISCQWQRVDDEDEYGNAAELYVNVKKYDDSRAAASRLQAERDDADGDGDTIVEVQLGDDAVRTTDDDASAPEDLDGYSYLIRIDNVVLRADADQAQALGMPDSGRLESLATDLAREIESRHPNR
ncbi:protein kinase [Kribbella sp. NPDC050124]|uniref:protein kinase domain-containing protein n=1 Tax=Kribbella sp. NPDC050124 TaxID=3364114 RepID=UPI0037AB5D50